MLIKEMEKGTDKHAVKSILSGLTSLINRNLSKPDWLDKNAVYDFDMNDKDFISVQNDSIWFSDCEDMETKNVNLENTENKDSQNFLNVKNHDIKLFRANLKSHVGKII